MKYKFTNNSVSGIHRAYRGFVVEVPGYSERVIDIPQKYEPSVISYLDQNYPALVVTKLEEKEPFLPPQGNPEGTESGGDENDGSVDDGLTGETGADEPPQPKEGQFAVGGKKSGRKAGGKK